MAYEDQDKCSRCGKSIPKMPEDAKGTELLCDSCNEIVEAKANCEMSVLKALEIIRGLAEGNALDPDDYFGEDLFDTAVEQERAFEVFDELVATMK